MIAALAKRPERRLHENAAADGLPPPADVGADVLLKPADSSTVAPTFPFSNRPMILPLHLDDVFQADDIALALPGPKFPPLLRQAVAASCAAADALPPPITPQPPLDNTLLKQLLRSPPADSSTMSPDTADIGADVLPRRGKKGLKAL